MINLLPLQIKNAPKSIKAIYWFGTIDSIQTITNILKFEYPELMFGQFVTLVLWGLTLWAIFTKSPKIFNLYKYSVGAYLVFYFLILLLNLLLYPTLEATDKIFTFVLLFSFLAYIAIYIFMLKNKNYFVKDSAIIVK